jgi:hypothetical protein
MSKRKVPDMKKINTREDVYELLSASTASAALGAAIETGLLWLLVEKPLDGAGVAQALNIPGKRCHYWLQYLHSLGILKETPHGYAPSSQVRNVILDSFSMDSWKHQALDERERSAGVHNLALYISEPGSIWTAQGLAEPRDYVEKMRGSLDRAREFTRMLYEVHQNLGNELASRLDLTGVRRLMDLGGNSGVVSMALLRKSPGLTATVVDIENVCIAGREIAEQNSFSDRITYYPAEFNKDAFPGGFDMIIECDVSIFGAELFRKLRASLNQGGRLVIVDHFSPSENLAPASRLEWSFLDSLEDPNFSIPTMAQVRRQLVQAGFQPLPGEDILPNNWTVIQAQK